MYGQHFQQSMDQPGVVDSPARGHLKRAKGEKMTLFSLSSLFAPPEDVVSRDRFGGPVLRQPAAHSPHSRLNVVFTCGIPPHTVLLLYVGANCPCCCCSRITYLRTGELCVCVCFLPIHSGHQVRVHSMFMAS